MESHALSIKECLRFGWTTFKVRPWFLIGVTALTLVLSMLIPSTDADETRVWLIVIVGILSFLLTALIEVGVTSFVLKAHDKVEEAQLAYLWRPEMYLRFLGATFLLMLIILAGLVLLVVPGIIAALMLCFTTYLLVDRNLSPVAALKESRRITKGHRWKLLGFFIALVFVNILGVLALLVGLLVSMPVTSLAFVHAYRTLSAIADNETVVVPLPNTEGTEENIPVIESSSDESTAKA